MAPLPLNQSPSDPALLRRPADGALRLGHGAAALKPEAAEEGCKGKRRVDPQLQECKQSGEGGPDLLPP